MTDLQRAQEALAKELVNFSRQTALLKRERAEAEEAFIVARSLLNEHEDSRKLVLDPLFADLDAAEEADRERQTEMLK